MADGTIVIDEPSTIDKLLDCEELTVGLNTVLRERIQVAGAAAAEIATVTNSAPTGSQYGLLVRMQAPVEGAGAVTTRTPRVTLASDDPAVASLSVLDDWDESERAKVNIIVGQAGVAAGAGAVGATVQRVTLASDDPAVATLGATSGAAIITDVDGTIQRYLRGLVKLAITAGGWLVTASGDVAHDFADSGSPVKVGGKATSSEPAAVASGDRANFITDLVGKLITLPYANPENFVSGAITSAMTGTTSTSLVAAPGAGLRNYITTLIVSNAHATVGTDVIIQDGSGGTTLLTIPAAAVYGGAIITLPVPMRQPTANTALYCANVTTGASTKVSAVGYKGA